MGISIEYKLIAYGEIIVSIFGITHLKLKFSSKRTLDKLICKSGKKSEVS